MPVPSTARSNPYTRQLLPLTVLLTIFAYVPDWLLLFKRAQTIFLQVNTEIVQIQRVQTSAGEAQLRGLIETHVENSRSKKGQAILDDWANQLPRFWQLVPPSESGTPEAYRDEEMDDILEKRSENKQAPAPAA